MFLKNMLKGSVILPDVLIGEIDNLMRNGTLRTFQEMDLSLVDMEALKLFFDTLNLNYLLYLVTETQRDIYGYDHLFLSKDELQQKQEKIKYIKNNLRQIDKNALRQIVFLSRRDQSKVDGAMILKTLLKISRGIPPLFKKESEIYMEAIDYYRLNKERINLSMLSDREKSNLDTMVEIPNISSFLTQKGMEILSENTQRSSETEGFFKENFDDDKREVDIKYEELKEKARRYAQLLGATKEGYQSGSKDGKKIIYITHFFDDNFLEVYSFNDIVIKNQLERGGEVSLQDVSEIEQEQWEEDEIGALDGYEDIP